MDDWRVCGSFLVGAGGAAKLPPTSEPPARLTWSRSHGEELDQSLSANGAHDAADSFLGGSHPLTRRDEPVAALPGRFLLDQDGSAWDCLCGQGGYEGDLQGFLLELEQKPEFRAGVMLQALSRLRDVLKSEPEDAALETMVPLLMRDALVISRALLERLR